MKQAIIVFLLFFLLNSCIKEESSITKLKINNTTNHSIYIQPYKYGVLFSQGAINLQAHQLLNVGSYFHRGKINSPLFFPQYADGDSVIVVFDSSYSISHYRNNVLALSKKFYDSESLRNLLNHNSYIGEITVDKKHSRTWEVTYTFTEQDYLDAK